jgi:hypothetical protein
MQRRRLIAHISRKDSRGLHSDTHQSYPRTANQVLMACNGSATPTLRMRHGVVWSRDGKHSERPQGPSTGHT